MNNNLNLIVDKLNTYSNGKIDIKITDEFRNNLRDFNRIIYESYKACKSNDPKNNLKKIRDPDGNIFINPEYIDDMLDNKKCNDLIKTYDNLLQKRRDFYNYISNHQSQDETFEEGEHQIGGSPLVRNKTSKLRKTIKNKRIAKEYGKVHNKRKLKKTPSVKRSYPLVKRSNPLVKRSNPLVKMNRKNLFLRGGSQELNSYKIANDEKLPISKLQSVLDIGSKIGVKTVDMLNPFNIYKMFKQYEEVIVKTVGITAGILDWFLFPIYHLEQIPIMGAFIEVPLDILAGLIDGSDFIFELLGPIIPIIIDIILDIIEAIPVVGDISVFISIPFNITQPFLQELIQNGSSIIGFFLAVARKQWNFAYQYMMDFVPYFETVMNNIVRIMIILNKGLNYFNDTIENIDSVIHIGSTIVEDPTSLVNPYKFIENIMAPNANRVELFHKFFEKVPEINKILTQNFIPESNK
jgi:hypothetical protein